jgi:hypothetical protein
MNAYDDSTPTADDELGYPKLFDLPVSIPTSTKATAIHYLSGIKENEEATTRITYATELFRGHLDVLRESKTIPSSERVGRDALILDYLPMIRQMAVEDDKELSFVNQKRNTRNSRIYTPAVDLTEQQRFSLDCTMYRGSGSG